MSSPVTIESAEQFNQLLKSSKIVIADCKYASVARLAPGKQWQVMAAAGLLTKSIFANGLSSKQSMPIGASLAKR